MYWQFLNDITLCQTGAFYGNKRRLVNLFISSIVMMTIQLKYNSNYYRIFKGAGKLKVSVFDFNMKAGRYIRMDANVARLIQVEKITTLNTSKKTIT